jgi:hypothetical protein
MRVIITQQNVRQLSLHCPIKCYIRDGRPYVLLPSRGRKTEGFGFLWHKITHFISQLNTDNFVQIYSYALTLFLWRLIKNVNKMTKPQPIPPPPPRLEHFIWPWLCHTNQFLVKARSHFCCQRLRSGHPEGILRQTDQWESQYSLHNPYPQHTLKC